MSGIGRGATSAEYYLDGLPYVAAGVDSIAVDPALIHQRDEPAPDEPRCADDEDHQNRRYFSHARVAYWVKYQADATGPRRSTSR